MYVTVNGAMYTFVNLFIVLLCVSLPSYSLRKGNSYVMHLNSIRSRA
jgi:hypothetical protein